MKREVVKGTASNIFHIFIQDSSQTDGSGLTGLVFDTASLTAYYIREGAATPVEISLVTATVGTFASGGFKEVDATNMPGVYELHPPDAAFLTGSEAVVIMLKGASNMAPLLLEITLIDTTLTTAQTLPGQVAPTLTPTVVEMLTFWYKQFRNKEEQTDTEYALYDDAGTTKDQKAVLSDDNTTFTKEEMGSGA